MPRSIAWLSAFVLILSISAPAQTSFTYPDFSSLSGLVTNGSVAQVGNVLELTPNLLSQVGTAYFGTQVPVDAGFDTIFNFQVTAAGQGADGFSFIIHNDASATSWLGVGGGTLGYDQLPNSLVIEFDLYLNGNHNDLSSNEVSIHTSGTAANLANETKSIGRITPTVTMADGQPHTVQIHYVPGTLQVFLDNPITPILSVPYTFATGGTLITNNQAVGGLSLNDAKAWVGFSGATGGISETHDILDWTWTSVLPWPPCMDGNVGATVGPPENVLKISGTSGGFYRTKKVIVGDAFSFDMGQPSLNPLPAQYVVFGLVGVPSTLTVFPTGFGDFCFPPAIVFPQPYLFTLMDSTASFGAIATTPPAPFSLPVATGLPFTVTLTLQGVLLENNFNPGTLRVTNGVVLDIVPAPAPVISSVTPLAAMAGTTITINGQNFRPGATLRVDGVPRPLLTLTPTQATFAMPINVPCDVSLNLTNTDGQVASIPVFNVTPIITSTNLGSGPAAGNANFLIVGQRFVTGATVTIGGNPATVVSNTGTVILVHTPPGMTGVATVVVTNPNGCFATTSYTYL